MAIIRRILRCSDGREEVFIPHRDRHNRFVMAVKQTDDPIQCSSNQILVESEDEVIQRLRSGKHSLRMTTGAKNAPANLIAAASIEIIVE
jgi:hypothetical protein